MTHISTIKELVDYFGGDTKLGEMLGISQPAVAQWKLRNQIASAWHARLIAEIKRRGVTVDASVFGLSAEDISVLMCSEPSREHVASV